MVVVGETSQCFNKFTQSCLTHILHAFGALDMCLVWKNLRNWESHGPVDPALLRACTLPVWHDTLASLW